MNKKFLLLPGFMMLGCSSTKEPIEPESNHIRVVEYTESNHNIISKKGQELLIGPYEGQCKLTIEIYDSPLVFTEPQVVITPNSYLFTGKNDTVKYFGKIQIRCYKKG